MVDIGSFALGLIAAIPGYVGLLITFWKGRLHFELERFQEPSTSPVESIWAVRILHPTKAIERCTVTVENKKYNLWVPLPPWNSSQPINFQTKIPKDGGANFRVPKTINPAGGFVMVRNGKKVIRKKEFTEIAETKP